MVKIITKLKNSEFGMKIREKFYPTKKADHEHYYLINDAMLRYEKSTDKKSISQIHREIKICKKYWKCYPHHYFTNDLYKKENKLTDNDLKNYIPQFYWYRLFLPYYRSSKFMILTGNKILTDKIFRSVNISQPETFFYLINGHLFSGGMVQTDPGNIEKELLQNTAEKLFVKPVDGSGGKDIYVFHRTDRGQFTTGQNILLNKDFIKSVGKKRDYIIQAGLKQDPEISKIYPNSVNTFRIFTQNKTGSARVACAMLRIGRGLGEIDNNSAGGISTNINIKNGKLGDFAISYSGEKFSHHPDTNFEFRNFTISRWEEIQKFAIESASKMPYFTHLGWDIALTPGGPAAIETNSNPAHDIVEMTGGGLREAFGIDDPDFYWKNPGKRL
jgi:hypothetical protein